MDSDWKRVFGDAAGTGAGPAVSGGPREAKVRVVENKDDVARMASIALKMAVIND